MLITRSQVVFSVRQTFNLYYDIKYNVVQDSRLRHGVVHTEQTTKVLTFTINLECHGSIKVVVTIYNLTCYIRDPPVATSRRFTEAAGAEIWRDEGSGLVLKCARDRQTII